MHPMEACVLKLNTSADLRLRQAASPTFFARGEKSGPDTEEGSEALGGDWLCRLPELKPACYCTCLTTFTQIELNAVKQASEQSLRLQAQLRLRGRACPGLFFSPLAKKVREGWPRLQLRGGQAAPTQITTYAALERSNTGHQVGIDTCRCIEGDLALRRMPRRSWKLSTDKFINLTGKNGMATNTNFPSFNGNIYLQILTDKNGRE